MARHYRYISGESHLETDSRNWIDRVPAAFRDRAPRLIHLPGGGDAWIVENSPLRQNASDLYGGKGRDAWLPYGQEYATTPGTGPAEQRLREQDTDGIDAEVLFPGQQAGPRLWRNITDDEVYKSVVRAYNDWLAEEYCAVDRDRLIGVGVIPWTNVDDAIAELQHCARQGLKAVVLGTFPSGKGQPTADDDRFWAAALDTDVAITVHVEFNRDGSRGGPLFKYPKEPKEFSAGRGTAAGGIVEQLTNPKFCRLGAVNAIQLIYGGVFDRFPDLRIDFAENQIGWIPFFLEMADTRYDRHYGWAERLLGVKPLQRRPSEYIREHCYWGFQHDKVGVELRHHLDVDRVIWATDFPHQESDWPDSLAVQQEAFVGVPADEQYQMVCGNAIEFFHLDHIPNRPG